MQANRTREGGSHAATARDAAELAQHEHTAMVEALMATIDLLDDIQNARRRVNVPKLREASGQKMRASAEAHALALAHLIADADADYGAQLVAYADSMKAAPIAKEA
jgi:hypothetical protein